MNLVMAMLFTLMPESLEPRAELPEPIPYHECVEIAGRLATYYWQERYLYDLAQPEVYCEVVKDET